MSEISTLLEMDWKNGALFIAAVVVAFVWVIQQWQWIVSKFGIVTKKALAEQKQVKDIDELKSHAKKTDGDIDKIIGSVNEIKDAVQQVSQQLTDLQTRVDDNERCKIGDRLTQAYNYYRKIGKWTQIQKWAFDSMVDGYKRVNGDGWIDEVVVPTSKTWEIIDDE